LLHSDGEFEPAKKRLSMIKEKKGSETMKNHLYQLMLLCAILGSFSNHLISEDHESKPNIIIIHADDLGYHDVGFNGATFYKTPNIDQLCQSGMKFTRAYSAGPNCAPTRASLVSGMYTPRHQIWTPGGASKGKIEYMKNHVPVRMPQKMAGPPNFVSNTKLSPSVVSIAEVLNKAGYKTARFGKWHLGEDLQGFHVSDQNGKGDTSQKNYYGIIDVHESLTDASIDFIKQNKEGPFFLYLNHWDVHTPIRARGKVVKKYQAQLDTKKWDRQWNPTYAAMIEAVDTSVGRIQRALKESKLSKKTLVIFTSDNGGVSGITTNNPLKGGKGGLYEGGVRVPTCMSWPGKISPGSECDTPIISVDFMPTFADLASAPLPKNQPVDGVSFLPLLKEKPLSERSIFWHYPMYLKGRGEDLVFPIHGSDKMYWRGVPSSMIVRGDWKMIQLFEDNSTLLYHLGKDPREENDCSASHPVVLSDLKAQLELWQKKTKALIPNLPNPRFTGLKSE